MEKIDTLTVKTQDIFIFLRHNLLLFHLTSQTDFKFLVYGLADPDSKRRGVLNKEAGFSYDSGTSETSFIVVALELPLARSHLSLLCDPWS